MHDVHKEIIMQVARRRSQNVRTATCQWPSLVKASIVRQQHHWHCSCLRVKFESISCYGWTNWKLDRLNKFELTFKPLTMAPGKYGRLSKSTFSCGFSILPSPDPGTGILRAAILFFASSDIDSTANLGKTIWRGFRCESEGLAFNVEGYHTFYAAIVFDPFAKTSWDKQAS